MKPLVIDSSARIDTLRDPGLAGHLVANYDLCAPALLQWEIGNVVHAKEPAVFGDPAKRKAVVHALVSHVRLVDQTGRLGMIADLVDRHALSFYDAAFLQLALDETCDLLTQDKKLLGAATREIGPSRAWNLARAKAAVAQGAF
ncbi:MAG: hypothetical protein QOE90_3075 [Thermoplasmata archaeon]|jgi:predicted nucleic acid-binding protein|nr:hypothetical protein [Thermoplasmata archaeon]